MKQIDTDFASGIVFLAISAPFGILAAGYGFGTPLRLGAGVFPLAAAILLALVGASLIVQSLRASRDRHPLAVGGLTFHRSDARSLVFIALALVFAALTLHRLGLGIAVPGAVLIASLASRELRPLQALILAAALTAFTYTIFVAGLGVRLPLILGVL
ncbi:Tricarboxylate transport protein TctB [Rubellimicrobium mesophilum DSM 19309]|uniref:Tricarboxylate transport protein TctB n=1 Tax=Rubellimicrobium mesophilum DSM 19309 TaxID=442562 RepID=A0A017HW42_9RHOB|nr:tripartite tricarboxylate transporter TctB family protein [Rubellimicrobium mesophilum]EYD78393.1 Tricarboxylate transport protein TctB [Rubellimicrobium mesophilum DSM 19309]